MRLSIVGRANNRREWMDARAKILKGEQYNPFLKRKKTCITTTWRITKNYAAKKTINELFVGLHVNQSR